MYSVQRTTNMVSYCRQKLRMKHDPVTKDKIYCVAICSVYEESWMGMNTIQEVTPLSVDEP